MVMVLLILRILFRRVIPDVGKSQLKYAEGGSGQQIVIRAGLVPLSAINPTI